MIWDGWYGGRRRGGMYVCMYVYRVSHRTVLISFYAYHFYACMYLHVGLVFPS